MARYGSRLAAAHSPGACPDPLAKRPATSNRTKPAAAHQARRQARVDAPPPHGSLIAPTFARGGGALRLAAYSRSLAGRLPGPANKARGQRPRLPGQPPRTRLRNARATRAVEARSTRPRDPAPQYSIPHISCAPFNFLAPSSRPSARLRTHYQPHCNARSGRSRGAPVQNANTPGQVLALRAFHTGATLT